MSTSDDLIDDAETDQMAALMSRCVKEILGRQDPGSFLQWLEKSGPRLLPGPFAAAPDPQTRRALTAALGATIWNATPLPENGYRPRPLRRPERNEPCPCGSGRKYKKCCALAPAFPPIPADAIWSMVVDHLPLREMKRLARERALPEPALESAAERLRDAGRPERAIRLLEPLFDARRTAGAGGAAGVGPAAAGLCPRGHGGRRGLPGPPRALAEARAAIGAGLADRQAVLRPASRR